MPIVLLMSLNWCFSLVLSVVCGVILASLTSSGSKLFWLLVLAFAILFARCWKWLKMLGFLASHPLRLGGFLWIWVLLVICVGMSVLSFTR